uniref:Zn(2)-C6 fungal-type domain-containing protein n=1 Tax=Mycena chlorophos TaxID=658473 RepID=A0ABQ0LYL8_MYCCL|nr:predicted protein [Mycena chlorophos]
MSSTTPKRVFIACETCRKGKIKVRKLVLCSLANFLQPLLDVQCHTQDASDAPCKRCARLGIPCVYTPVGQQSSGQEYYDPNTSMSANAGQSSSVYATGGQGYPPHSGSSSQYPYPPSGPAAPQGYYGAGGPYPGQGSGGEGYYSPQTGQSYQQHQQPAYQCVQYSRL